MPREGKKLQLASPHLKGEVAVVTVTVAMVVGGLETVETVEAVGVVYVVNVVNAVNAVNAVSIVNVYAAAVDVVLLYSVLLKTVVVCRPIRRLWSRFARQTCSSLAPAACSRRSLPACCPMV